MDEGARWPRHQRHDNSLNLNTEELQLGEEPELPNDPMNWSSIHEGLF